MAHRVQMNCHEYVNWISSWSASIMRDGRRDNDGGVYRENKRDREKYEEGKRMMLFALIVFNFVRVNSNGTTWLNFLFYFGELSCCCGWCARPVLKSLVVIKLFVAYMEHERCSRSGIRAKFILNESYTLVNTHTHTQGEIVNTTPKLWLRTNMNKYWLHLWIHEFLFLANSYISRKFLRFHTFLRKIFRQNYFLACFNLF